MKVTKTEGIILQLTAFEAGWLKALVQNAFVDYTEFEAEEDPQDKEMRQKFWEALGGSV